MNPRRRRHARKRRNAKWFIALVPYKGNKGLRWGRLRRIYPPVMKEAIIGHYSNIVFFTNP